MGQLCDRCWGGALEQDPPRRTAVSEAEMRAPHHRRKVPGVHHLHSGACLLFPAAAAVRDHRCGSSHRTNLSPTVPQARGPRGRLADVQGSAGLHSFPEAPRENLPAFSSFRGCTAPLAQGSPATFKATDIPADPSLPTPHLSPITARKGSPIVRMCDGPGPTWMTGLTSPCQGF